MSVLETSQNLFVYQHYNKRVMVLPSSQRVQ
jgi:hypothetical protein